MEDFPVASRLLSRHLQQVFGFAEIDCVGDRVWISEGTNTLDAHCLTEPSRTQDEVESHKQQNKTCQDVGKDVDTH